MAFKYQPRKAEEVEKRATQQGGEFEGFISDAYKTFAPKKGDNWVRILPPTWDKPAHYGFDIHVHYSVGPDKAGVICNLKQLKTPCAICEAKLRAEDSKDDELAKSLRWSRRVAVWMLDMNDEKKGPQIWAMPWTLDRDIAKISKDKRSGETYLIDDPDDGYDLNFDREGEGIATKYSGVQIARRPTSVDLKHVDYVVANPLPDCLNRRTYDVVAEIYTGGAHTDQRKINSRTAADDNSRDQGGNDDRPGREKRRDDDAPPARRSARDDDPPPARRSARDDDAPPRRAARDDDDDRPRRASRDDDEPPFRRAVRDDPDAIYRDSTSHDDGDDKLRRAVRDDRADRDDPPPRRAARDDDDDKPVRRAARDDDRDLPEDRAVRDDPPRRRSARDDDDAPPAKRSARDDDDDRPRKPDTTDDPPRRAARDDGDDTPSRGSVLRERFKARTEGKG